MSDVVTVPGKKLKAMQIEIAQLEAETKRLRKIEYAANAAYNCWAGEGKASPQLMEALRQALGGDGWN